TSCSLYRVIASSSSALGCAPFSDSLVAFTITMNFIVSSPRRGSRPGTIPVVFAPHPRADPARAGSTRGGIFFSPIAHGGPCRRDVSPSRRGGATWPGGGDPAAGGGGRRAPACAGCETDGAPASRCVACRGRGRSAPGRRCRGAGRAQRGALRPGLRRVPGAHRRGGDGDGDDVLAGRRAGGRRPAG